MAQTTAQGSAGASTGSAAATGTTGTTGAATANGTTGAAAVVVINEVNGKEADYAELFNPTAAAIDLSGWGVTEAKEGDGGIGAAKTAAVFPAGSTIPAQGYALVLGAPKDGGTVLGCTAGDVCITAAWNLSNSSGAEVYLLDPSSNTVEQEVLPAGVSGDGQSFGRLPNGSGTFQLNAQTPGATNQGP